MNTLPARLTLAAACGMAAAPTVSHAVMPTCINVYGVDGEVVSSAGIGSFHWLGALTPDGEFTPFRTATAGGLEVIEGPLFDEGRWQNFSLTVRDASADTVEPFFTITMADVMVSPATRQIAAT